MPRAWPVVQVVPPGGLAYGMQLPIVAQSPIFAQPWEAGAGVGDIVAMCDSMNFVLDETHAGRYDAVLGRRGVRFTMEQARRFVTPTGKARMWQYDRAPDYIRPEKIIAGIRALGVDTTAWET